MISLEAFYVAATLAALLQFLRLREKGLLPLVSGLALLAMAHHQGEWFAARPWHLAAGVALLVAVAMLSPRSPSR